MLLCFLGCLNGSWLVGHSNVFRMVSIVLLCNSWVLRLVSRVLLCYSKTRLDNSRVSWVVTRVFLCLEYF